MPPKGRKPSRLDTAKSQSQSSGQRPISPTAGEAKAARVGIQVSDSSNKIAATASENLEPGVASAATISQWEEAQKRTFTKWVNAQLSALGVGSPRVSDLATDFCNGQTLLILLRTLASKSPPVSPASPTASSSSSAALLEPEKHSTLRIHFVSNVGKALRFVELHSGEPLPNIGPEDIVDGNPKLILGLIWQLILRFQLSSLTGIGDTDDPPRSPDSETSTGNLLVNGDAANSTSSLTSTASQDVNGRTGNGPPEGATLARSASGSRRKSIRKKKLKPARQGATSTLQDAQRRILELVRNILTSDESYMKLLGPSGAPSNLGTAWSDGRAFCCLVHALAPEKLPLASIRGGEEMTNDDKRNNLNLAFQVANESLNVPSILETDDVIQFPDEKSILTYLFSFAKMLKSLPAATRKSEPVPSGGLDSVRKSATTLLPSTNSAENDKPSLPGDLSQRGAEKNGLIKHTGEFDNKSSVTLLSSTITTLENSNEQNKVAHKNMSQKSNVNLDNRGTASKMAPGEQTAKPGAETDHERSAIVPTGSTAAAAQNNNPNLNESVSNFELVDDFSNSGVAAQLSSGTLNLEKFTMLTLASPSIISESDTSKERMIGQRVVVKSPPPNIDGFEVVVFEQNSIELDENNKVIVESVSVELPKTSSATQSSEKYIPQSYTKSSAEEASATAAFVSKDGDKTLKSDTKGRKAEPTVNAVKIEKSCVVAQMIPLKCHSGPLNPTDVSCCCCKQTILNSPTLKPETNSHPIFCIELQALTLRRGIEAMPSGFFGPHFSAEDRRTSQKLVDEANVRLKELEKAEGGFDRSMLEVDESSRRTKRDLDQANKLLKMRSMRIMELFCPVISILLVAVIIFIFKMLTK